MIDKIKTTLIFLFFSCSIFSQQISTRYVDEFTKDNIIQVNASKNTEWQGTDNIAKGLFNNIFLSLKQINATKILQLDIQIGGMLCINNNEDKIILLLENNETLELKQGSRLDCANRLLTKYIISDIQINLLSINPINKFRIYTYDGYITLEVKEDKKELIKNTFTLFKSKT